MIVISKWQQHFSHLKLGDLAPRRIQKKVENQERMKRSPAQYMNNLHSNRGLDNSNICDHVLSESLADEGTQEGRTDNNEV